MFAHLQLDNYFIPEFHIKANPNYDRKAKKRGAKLDFRRIIRSNKKDTNKYLVEIHLGIQPIKGDDSKYCPYFLEVDVHGYFHFEKQPETEQEKDKLLAMNGPAILYGLIRGQVAQMTAMGPYGRYILPTINLNKIEKEKERKKKSKKS